MKNILINGLSALEGGSVLYLKNILAYVNKYSNLRVFILASPRLREEILKIDGVNLIPCNWATKSLFHRILWLHYNLFKILTDYNIDVIWFPDGLSHKKVLNKCKVVITLQNLLPFDLKVRKRYPFSYMKVRFSLIKYLQSQSVKKADLIIYVSNYMKSIIDNLQISSKDNYIVIPHGLADEFRSNTPKKISSLAWMRAEYVLYVSRIHVYKNQIEIIEAWSYLKRIRKTNEKLILIGPYYHPYYKLVNKKIKSLGLQDDIIYVGEIKHELLPIVYGNAKAHIWASSCESFGMILLEKMASKKIVFASDTKFNREIAGETAVYFDPFQPEELANLLSKYLDNDGFKRNMGEAAYKRTLLFDWKISANKTWRYLSNLAEC